MGTKKQKSNSGSVASKTVYLLVVAAIVVVGALLIGWWGLSSKMAAATCVTLRLPVALAKDKPADQVVEAHYCQPGNWAMGPHQLDVLTAGAGYNSSYYDWPEQSDQYSYVKKTLAAGRATLNYDRIAAGNSSRPVSTDVTLGADSFVLHQLVQSFRLTGYQQINSIAHSYGTGVAIDEAANYADVTRVIATGYLHDARNPVVATRNYPANQDAAFKGLNLDDGYLTSKPDTRGDSFYSPAGDKSIIAYDDAHKDVISRTAFVGYAGQQGAPAATNVSGKITAPVLVVVGQKDGIFCTNAAVLDCTNQGAVQTFEEPFYKMAKSLKVVTVANTGHDIALHPSAQESFDTINEWIKGN
jgi:pimeloyl-ACP methyl ester carboxylesterase